MILRITQKLATKTEGDSDFETCPISLGRGQTTSAFRYWGQGPLARDQLRPLPHLVHQLHADFAEAIVLN